jgi:hypothetical protein
VQYGYIVVMGVWWIEAMQPMCSQVQLDLQTQYPICRWKFTLFLTCGQTHQRPAQ